MSRKIVVPLVVLCLSVAACSGSEPEPAPAAPSSPSSSSSSSVSSDEVHSSSPSPKGELSRAEGGKKYLEIVKPYNEAFAKCMDAYEPVVDSMSTTADDFPKIRKACGPMGEVNRRFGDGLEAVNWPAEADDSVRDLIDTVRAEQLAWRDMGKVRTYDDLFDPKNQFSQDRPADLVRAHLGLPRVEEG